MAHILCDSYLLPPLISHSTSCLASNWGSPHLSTFPNLRSKCSRLVYSAAPKSMTPMANQGLRFKDFPYTSPPIRDLMLESLSTVETLLKSQLLPCTLPPDVQYYRNQSGTNHGSIFVLSGAPSSLIDIVFGSWLHCQLPTGASLSISTLLCYMNDSSDAPSFLMEFIQASPTSLVILLDLPPRRDLVMHPHYINTFYEDTELSKHRQLLLDSIPEAEPYESPSLYIRSAFSPTAIMVRVDTSEGGEGRLEEILRGKVRDAVKTVLETWLDVCALREGQGELDEEDKAYLRKRDAMFKNQSIEIDLGGNLPRLFGQDVADRVISELMGVMGARVSV